MSNNIITAERFLTIRCKAFSGQGVRNHRVHVEADMIDSDIVTRGNVRVWDDIAGHFTLCHALSDRTIKKIRATFQP